MTYPAELSYGPASMVVLIGTSACPNDEKNLPPLPHAQANVEELKRLFLDREVVGLPESNVIAIVDEPEASSILTKVDIAAKAATDTLIIYYTGHGLYGDQHAALYLTSKNTVSDTKPSAINIDEIKKSMRASRATKRILILDCCYSGRAFDGGMNDTRDDFTSAIDLSGTYGIAAVPGDRKAWAPPGANLTKFTQVLVDVLDKGLDSSKTILTLDDVFLAVREKVGRDAQTALPQRSNWENGGQFKLARNRFAKQGSLEAAYQAIETLQNALRDTNLRIEALEKKTTSENPLEPRIEAIELSVMGRADLPETEEVHASRRSLLTRLSIVTPPWVRLEISRNVWDMLPAAPHKILIMRHIEAQRNAKLLYMWEVSLLFAIGYMGAVIGSPLISTILYRNLIFVCTGLLFFTQIVLLMAFMNDLLARKRGPFLLDYMGNLPPVLQDICHTNVPIATAFATRLLNIAGLPFEDAAAKRALSLGAVASMVAIFLVTQPLKNF